MFTTDEYSPLRRVVVGRVGTKMVFNVDINTTIAYQHYVEHAVPRTVDGRRGRKFMSDLEAEVEGLVETLEAEGVEVLRPHTVEQGVTQIFARDTGIVIEDVYVEAGLIDSRSSECAAVTQAIADATPAPYRVLRASGQRPDWTPTGDVAVTHDATDDARSDAPAVHVLEADGRVTETRAPGSGTNPDGKTRVLAASPTLKMEGGDVMQHGDTIFVGVGNRTTPIFARRFLKRHFPHKTIVEVPLRYTPSNTAQTSLDMLVGEERDAAKGEWEQRFLDNVLHLDCIFQPLGPDCAVLWREGVSSDRTWRFQSPGGRLYEETVDVATARTAFEDAVADAFDTVIEVEDATERAHLCTNLLAIAPGRVLSLPSFSSTNEQLRTAGVEVVEVEYETVSRLGGLFRCSTVPLCREG